MCQKRIKEAIIVEGRDDTRALKLAFDCYTIETHGFHISHKTWIKINAAYEKQGIIIFTDPDFAGESIRKRIKEKFPNACDCYIAREKAYNGVKYGIEYAKTCDIREAILKAKGTIIEKRETFSWDMMLKYNLVFDKDSKRRRDILGSKLGIGYGNGKSFLKKLNNYGVTIEDFEKEVLEIEKSL